MNRLRLDLGLHTAQSAQEQLLLEKFAHLTEAADAYRKATGNRVDRTELATIRNFSDHVTLTTRSQSHQEICDTYLQVARSLYDAAFNAHLRTWQTYWKRYEAIVVPHLTPESKVTEVRNSKNKAVMWNEISVVVQTLSKIKESRPESYPITQNWSKEFEDYQDLFEIIDAALDYMTEKQVAVEAALNASEDRQISRKGYYWGLIGLVVTIIIAVLGWTYFAG